MLYLCILISTRYVFDKKKLKKKESYVLTKKIKIISKFVKLKLIQNSLKWKRKPSFAAL